MPRYSMFRFSWGRLIGTLVLVLASLQIIHLSLLNRLEAKTNEDQRLQALRHLLYDSSSLFQKMKENIEGSSILDTSGEYKVVNFVVEAESIKNKVSQDLTLVTQCSVNHLHHLINLSQRWQGPISVAVFTPGNHLNIAIETLIKLHQCIASFRQNVSVHLVYPLTSQPQELNHRNSNDFQCSDNELLKLKSDLSLENYDLKGYKYPNNLLRNLASKNSRTEYIFVIDVDMLPNKDLHSDFLQFSNKYKLFSDQKSMYEKTVFVIPAFEVETGVPIPNDKKDLLKLWSSERLRPFYYELCWKCHRNTDYDAWQNLANTHDLQMAFELDWTDPWEPFYIAKKSIPLYDERFKQYGFNRISQVSSLVHSGRRSHHHIFYRLAIYSCANLPYYNPNVEPFREWLFNPFMNACSMQKARQIRCSYNSNPSIIWKIFLREMCVKSEMSKFNFPLQIFINASFISN